MGIDVFDKMIRLVKKENVDFGAGFPTCSFFASIKDVNSIKSFDKSMRRLEDIEFAIRASFENSHFIGTNEVLVVQNHTIGSHKTALKNYIYEKYILDKHVDRLKNKEYQYLKMWLKIRCSWFLKKYISTLNYFLKLLKIDYKRAWSGIVIAGIKRITHEIRTKQF